MLGIKRIFIDSVLIVVFILLILTIALSFVAKMQFEDAKKLEVNYRWKRAEEKYRSIIKLNHFNAPYAAGYGDFLRRQGRYRKDEIAYLKQAEELYKRALRLNTGWAEYYLKLGGVQLKIGLQSTVHGPQSMVDSPQTQKYVADVFASFKKALQKDPNGFNTSYSIAYTGIQVWDFLDASEKAFVLNRFGYCLRVRSWYGKYIYPHVWKYTKDSKILHSLVPDSKLRLSYSGKEKEDRRRLLRSLRDLAMTEGIDGNRLKLVLRKDWQGKSKSGKSTYENGNMYWTGTIDAAINMPHGETIVMIKAKGSQADGIWPYMVVELDGGEIGETFVNMSDWKEYSFKVNTDGGIKVLSATFTNDGGNKEKGEDRNLYVGEAKVEGIK